MSRTERAGSARRGTWRETVWHGLTSSERRRCWARLNGWTLFVSESKVDGRFRASAHRFRDGSADMPTCPLWFDTAEEAQLAAEHYASTGAWV